MGIGSSSGSRLAKVERRSPVHERIRPILATTPVRRNAGDVIGQSRDGASVCAFRIGTGAHRVSLLGGCHADEPVGPLLLRHLAAYLLSLPDEDPMLQEYEWWLIPHVNPDGEARNRRWYGDDDAAYDLTNYLAGVVREPPGDDIEFGFPETSSDHDARPEPRAAYEWWRRARGPFALHASLHGMAFAAGPWFLIDETWRHRSDHLKERCTRTVTDLGYVLHDVERKGEKGFVRLGPGFCTRPHSAYMRRHFLDLGDRDTANRFRPSSMETIRSFGGDPLTLVSEMPLFITPGVGETLGPPDPVALEWKERIEQWRVTLQTSGTDVQVREEAARAGLHPMPVRDQMTFQWTFIVSGLEQVALDLASAGGGA